MYLPSFLHTARPAPFGRSAGFTMVELIVVMILIGILSAIGVSRFFIRTGYESAAYAEQARAMVRYAQKLAVAQSRPVYVHAILDQNAVKGIGLCFDAAGSDPAAPCKAASQVPAPSGANSGNAATRARCLTDDKKYAPGWYCEGVPAGVDLTPVSGTLAPFWFDALGVPRADGAAFTGLIVSISGDGVASQLSVSQETGYVN